MKTKDYLLLWFMMVVVVPITFATSVWIFLTTAKFLGLQ